MKKRGLSTKIGIGKNTILGGLVMKTISEIIGGAQGLLDIGFELQNCFEEKLNGLQKTFLHMLRCLEENLSFPERQYAGTGRRPYMYLPYLRSQLAKNYFQINATSKLIERLKADPNLRLLCGFKTVPSKASFSRALSYFASKDIVAEAFESVVKKTLKDKVVYHVCRDSTAIHAREKAEKKKGKRPQTIHGKLGRPRKNEENREKRPKKIPKVKNQIHENPYDSLEQLNKKCAVSCKLNSHGIISYWKGYKLHLDVSDWGFPITACVTGANVQDCLLAIPMEKITEQRVAFCYSLMDKGYDSNIIRSFIESRQRVPIIGYKKRNNGNLPLLDEAKKERSKIRSAVERANSHLKDLLIPKVLYVKGYNKVSFVLLSAVLCLAALKYLQDICS